MPAILEVKNLSKSIGDLILFSDISFSLEQGSKTGLIARNGAGKTTLLNILAGSESCDEGKRVFLPGIKVGYLSQEPLLNENHTITDAIFHSNNPVLNLIKNYELAVQNNHHKEVERLSVSIDNLKAWDYENRIKQILYQIGIQNTQQKVAELSGGQKKRVALASVLVEDPDLLILDEPTNHLDIKAISWLEEYLKRSAVSLLMVTHDRYFLDRVCSCILEIDNQSVFNYAGNYTHFLKKRSERIELSIREIEKAENLLRKEEDWIRRMPKARGTKAKYRIENYFDLKDKASQSIREEKIRLNIAGERLGNKILTANSIFFAWSGEPLIHDFTYTFSRYEKIGILGENGCGKSTLLEILTGNIKPQSGKIETGETIKFGFYRQEGIQFDESIKVKDIVSNIAETITLGNGKVVTAMQLLTHFLFPPARQHDYIYKLSGGEKRRLYLCTVLMQNPNFLILDEPTNDLDIATLEILEDYLHEFAGCVLVVSHDRYFLDEVVDHVFAFEGKGRIKDFPGNYTQFYEWKSKQIKSDQPKLPTDKRDKPKLTETSRKLSYKEKTEYESLEQEISKLEQEKQAIEELLSSGNLNHEQLQENALKVGELMRLIEEKSNRWFVLAEKKGE